MSSCARWFLPGLVAVIFASPLAIAQDDLRRTTSLKFVPAEVGFYVSSLQLRRQVETVVNSNAYRRVRELPIVQMAISQAEEKWNNPEDAQLKAYKTVLEMPENKQLIEMLLDAVSHEVFFYGDESFAKLLPLANRLNSVNQQASFEALATGEKSEEIAARRMLRELTAIADNLTVPDVVVGFKLSDPKPAEAQLTRLEGILGFVLGRQPQWKGRLQRQKLGETEFLTFQFQGSDVPWDQLEEKVPEDQRPDFQKLAESLQRHRLSLALGVFQDYLVLSVGDNYEHLTRLGQGAMLADRAEMAPLAKLGAKSFTTISFTGGEFVRMARANQEQQLDDLVSMAEKALPATALDENGRKELMDDLRALRQQFLKYIPEAGAVSSFIWLTDRGLEGYAYQWSGGRSLNDDKPLSILDHTGGSLAFFAGRTKVRAEDYEFAIKFLERLIYHSEKIGLPKLQATDREQYERVRRELTPLVVRWRATVREKIIPALADGQSALVVDARTTSTQWHQLLPPSSQPLPIPELALVLGVSDAELLKQGVGESIAIAREAIARLHQLFPDKVPDVEIPAAQRHEVAGGVVYFYLLPADAGFDKQVAPNAGLGKDVAVISLIPKQTTRLLDKVTPSFQGPLSRAHEPLAAAAYVNFADGVKGVSRWLQFGVQVAEEQNVAQSQLQVAKDPLRVILEVMTCLREFSAVTYSEGSAAVSHFEWRFEDLE